MCIHALCIVSLVVVHLDLSLKFNFHVQIQKYLLFLSFSLPLFSPLWAQPSRLSSPSLPSSFFFPWQPGPVPRAWLPFLPLPSARPTSLPRPGPTRSLPRSSVPSPRAHGPLPRPDPRPAPPSRSLPFPLSGASRGAPPVGVFPSPAPEPDPSSSPSSIRSSAPPPPRARTPRRPGPPLFKRRQPPARSKP
jgi:hypothetical protein